VSLFGLWAQRPGDEQAQKFPATQAGLEEAAEYCGTNGTIAVFPGSSDGPGITPPDLELGVNLLIHEDGHIRRYTAGGLTEPVAVNVRAYGAKGDGTTDDVEAFERAQAALPADGGEMIMPNGSYAFSRSLTLEKSITLRGTGFNADGSTNHPCEIVKLGSATTPAIVTTGAACHLTNFAVRGLTGNTGYGILCLSTRFAMSHVLVTGIGSSSVDGDRAVVIGDDSVVNCNDWRIDRCFIRSNASDGLYVASDDGSGGPNANAGCTTLLSSQLNGGKGIWISKCSVSSFFNSHIEENDEEGLYVDGNSDGNLFIGGDCEGNNGATGVSPQVQVRVAGPSANDNVFILPGLQGGWVSFDDSLDPNPRSTIFFTNKVRICRASGGNDLNGNTNSEWFSNGPEGMDGNTTGGGYHSHYMENEERLRVGVILNNAAGVPQTPPDVIPGQLMYSVTDNRLYLLARTNADTHALYLGVGQTGANRRFLEIRGTSVASGGRIVTNAPIETPSYVDLQEMSAPATPPANTVRLFCRDVAGVTTLSALLPTGATVDLAP
jgi:hypothetical protein